MFCPVPFSTSYYNCHYSGVFLLVRNVGVTVWHVTCDVSSMCGRLVWYLCSVDDSLICNTSNATRLYIRITITSMFELFYTDHNVPLYFLRDVILCMWMIRFTYLIRLFLLRITWSLFVWVCLLLVSFKILVMYTLALSLKSSNNHRLKISGPNCRDT